VLTTHKISRHKLCTQSFGCRSVVGLYTIIQENQNITKKAVLFFGGGVGWEKAGRGIHARASSVYVCSCERERERERERENRQKSLNARKLTAELYIYLWEEYKIYLQTLGKENLISSWT
jgi:hypothetical protein